MAGLRARGKIAQNSLGEVIKMEVGKKVYSRLTEAGENLSLTVARVEKAGGLGFHSVTGNLYTSIGITVIRNDPKTGKYILSRNFSPYTMLGGKPTRKPLKARERYNLPFYYSGEQVPRGKRGGYRGYKAPVDSDGGSTKGPDLAIDYRNDLRGSKSGSRKKWFSLYLYATMPYTKYVDKNNEGQLHETLRDLLRRQFGK